MINMIGVFDSGFGGLTVLREFLRILPEYDYVYLGDNERAPYGEKTQKEIYKNTCEGLDFLFGKGCCLVIVACNTASAKALRKIQQEYLPKNYPDKKVLGVIIPTAEEIGEKKLKRVGIIGTKSTIASKTYIREIKKINKQIEIFQKSCPGLVPLIEGGKNDTPEMKKKLQFYLNLLKKKKITALVLGCTHYPVLEREIRGVIGSEIDLINPPAIIARKLGNYLKRHKEIDKKLGKKKKRIFYTTGNAKKFSELGGRFLGRRVNKVEKIALNVITRSG